MSSDIDLNSEPVRGLAFFVRVLGQDLGDVRAVAAVLGHDLQPGLGVRAELDLLAGRVGEQLLGLLEGQLVGRQVVGHVGALAAGVPSSSGPSTYGP